MHSIAVLPSSAKPMPHPILTSDTAAVENDELKQGYELIERPSMDLTSSDAKRVPTTSDTGGRQAHLGLLPKLTHLSRECHFAEGPSSRIASVFGPRLDPDTPTDPGLESPLAIPLNQEAHSQSPSEVEPADMEDIPSEPDSNVEPVKDSIVEAPPEETAEAESLPHNIIIFGATGAGKSSVVNMIADKVVATTSSDATGCTFQSQPHDVEIDGARFVLWDTSGLNEGDKGRVPAEQAVENLYSLARGLSDGVSLLIYCVRGPRINANTADNYELFYRGLCQGRVPIILVVTALEGVTSKDEWWLENEPTYREQGMQFSGHACVVSTKGKRRDGKYLFQDEYTASQVDLRALLCSTVKESPQPWKIEVNGWLGAIANVIMSRGQVAHPANVVIFGEAGAGKSSLINLIRDDNAATTASSAEGCTFESKSYDVTIRDKKVRLWDTVGLNEGDQGKVDPKRAIASLYSLTTHLQNGVSLLVYCIARGRITRTTVTNYLMFYEGVCQTQVPIVLVITGLEHQEPNMDSWWKDNEQAFTNEKMEFAGHACITATKGKLRNGTYTYAAEYMESGIVTRDLISRELRMEGPWKLQRESKIATISKTAYNFLAGWLGVERVGIYKALHEVLSEYYPGELSPAELAAISNDIVLEAPTNVVVFGETGVGKSSVINMIAGRNIAKVSNTARGCTFQSTSYDVSIGGSRFRLWDTAGMNENEKGSVAAKDAIISLYKLMDSLEAGIGLLVYCIRGRIKETTVQNYRLFYEGICLQEVPIVLVINALELEEPNMNSWWFRNEPAFTKQGMEFDGHACVTATKGRCTSGVYMFAAEYEESQVVTRRLFQETVRKPWKLPKASTVPHLFKRAYNLLAGKFGLPPFVLCQVLYDVLKKHGGFSLEEARAIANDFDNGGSMEIPTSGQESEDPDEEEEEEVASDEEVSGGHQENGPGVDYTSPDLDGSVWVEM
ncbi:hypothetical protein HWV62_1346 [Athelia sp. TMB]|nr:hypothetical protein HWV62_1346 [Athelia sp. TMB]